MKILTQAEADRMRDFLAAFKPPPKPEPNSYIVIDTDIFGLPEYSLSKTNVR